MKLWDIMHMSNFQDMLLKKYIRVNWKNGLGIVNYTEKAQYENVWNEVTEQCRGLVIDRNWNILARPFDKFHNFGMNTMEPDLMDYPVQVTDKMDGSLGILFYQSHDPYASPDLMDSSPYRHAVAYGGTWHVATRGSFDSEQAEEMRKILDEKYTEKSLFGFMDHLPLDKNWTYMFEIVYPENRIVLDYGDTRDLFLLGARNNHTGLVRPAEDVHAWKGPKTKTFPYKTLREALEAPPRPNAEGYVIYFPDLDYRVKVKQEDYVALHKIVTGLTSRRIWELMKLGKSLADIMEIVPDEWHVWASNTYKDIQQDYNLLGWELDLLFSGIMEKMPKDFTRKEFAAEAMKVPSSGLMFALLDKRDISEKMWDMVRPSAE